MKKIMVSGTMLVALFLMWGPFAETKEPIRVEAGATRVVPHGAMSVERAAHQATVLRTGEVLVTGGCAERGCERMLASAEVYDRATGTFRTVAGMSTPRASHAAIALPDGRVLVTGGWTGRHATASAELYDPVTGRFTPAGNMVAARMSHSAVALPDSRVLLCCGSGTEAFAEIFDPATSTFSAVTGSRTPAGGYVAVAIADGRVLVTGGKHEGNVLRLAEVFDPATGKFQPTGNMTMPRHKHAAALLPDGRALIIGGSSDGPRESYASTEIYDPATGEFSPGPTMRWPRYKLRDAVAQLPSGALLVTAGAVRPEILDPVSRKFVALGGELSGRQMFATASLLATGEVLVLGGYDEQIRPSASAWLALTGR